MMSQVRIGGIVLCGGLSTRMGRPKAWLPFGKEFMVQRVVRLLGEAVSPVVVVAAAGQAIPQLAADVIVTRDEREALGPVGGLSAGFAALRGKVDAAYVTACDVPLLNPDVIRRICQSLDGNDIAITVDGGFHHPLAAVYRFTLESKVEQLIAANRLRPVFLMEQSQVVEIPIENFRDVDPFLDSFRNTNTPEEYFAALEMAGFERPEQFSESST